LTHSAPGIGATDDRELVGVGVGVEVRLGDRARRPTEEACSVWPVHDTQPIATIVTATASFTVLSTPERQIWFPRIGPYWNR
jgi:hypothetical protein